ncbi:hypothetical protein vBEliSR6L_26 [Erythrobacter phage vB_EliS_R6L]|nr:hypothetical protein vBEliSR6L_26 [Erythrobacter phage vB_EliS_R6L]
MSNIHARAREAAADWLDGKDWHGNGPEKSAPDDLFTHDAVLDAFAAGAEWAITPQSQDDLNQIVAGVIRDAQAAGTDEAADDAALAIFAYLGAIHREEQDLWGARFAAAGELIAEASALFRSYEAHHRAEADRLAAQGTGATADQERNRAEKAERNGKIADKLERWLLDRNPAEVLRQAAAGMVDGETIKGVDHASFDRAADFLDQTAGPIGHRVSKRSGDYEFDGEVVAIIPKRSGAIRYAVEDDRGLLLVMNARQCGLPEPEDRSPRSAPWRQQGVADLAAFRITTADPRFDPAGPVTINGFLYRPVKEDDDNG